MTSSGTGHLGRGLVFRRSGSCTGCILYAALQPSSGHASLQGSKISASRLASQKSADVVDLLKCSIATAGSDLSSLCLGYAGMLWPQVPPLRGSQHSRIMALNLEQSTAQHTCLSPPAQPTHSRWAQGVAISSRASAVHLSQAPPCRRATWIATGDTHITLAHRRPGAYELGRQFYTTSCMEPDGVDTECHLVAVMRLASKVLAGFERPWSRRRSRWLGSVPRCVTTGARAAARAARRPVASAARDAPPIAPGSPAAAPPPASNSGCRPHSRTACKTGFEGFRSFPLSCLQLQHPRWLAPLAS